MNKEFILIENETDLYQTCLELKGSSWLAVDTEFERVKTYFPELCLLQIANDSITTIIDPLAIGNMEVVYDLLYDESISKVFHSARQDLEIFFNIKGTVPCPVFDTQIAARSLGFDDQIGYANLVKQTLGVELSKAHTRTDWKRRPLQQSHLRYAADDVIYLGEVYELFLKQLENLNGDSFSLMEQKNLALTDATIYQTDPETMWQKIYEARKFKGSKLSVLQHLASWRELTARLENQPRKWLMSDQTIVAMANNLPGNETELSEINKMYRKLVKRHGSELLKIVEEAQQLEPRTRQ